MTHTVALLLTSPISIEDAGMSSSINAIHPGEQSRSSGTIRSWRRFGVPYYIIAVGDPWHIASPSIQAPLRGNTSHAEAWDRHRAMLVVECLDSYARHAHPNPVMDLFKLVLALLDDRCVLLWKYEHATSPYALPTQQTRESLARGEWPEDH